METTKTNTFNYNPSGVDRRKRFPVLLMKSGTYRWVDEYGVSKQGLPAATVAPNGYDIYQNVGWHMIFDVCKTDKYISFVRYYTQSTTYRLSDFRKTVHEKETFPVLCGICSWGTMPEAIKNLDQWLNFRFYPDGSMAAIITFISEKENIKRSFQLDLNEIPSSEWSIWVTMYLKKLGLSRTPEEQRNYDRYYSRREEHFNALDADKVIKEVWSDDEVKPQKFSKKQARLVYSFLVSSGMGATLLHTSDKGIASEKMYLPKEWMEFFPDLKDTRLQLAKRIAEEEFCDHRLNEKSGYSYGNGDGPDKFYPSILFANAGISDSYLNKKETTNTTLSEIWNHGFDKTLKRGQASIRRCSDDEIAVSITGHYSDYDGYRQSYLFIYNTKKGTKKIYEKRYHTENKSAAKFTQIPITGNNIFNFIAHIKSKYDRYYSYNPIVSTVLIQDDLSKILDKTLCNWILKSAKEGTLPNDEETNTALLFHLREYTGGTPKYRTKMVSIKEWATTPEEQIDSFWFKILLEILLREKLYLEQLAKCGLWNIFSNCILTDAAAQPGSAREREGKADLIFNAKSKSLTNSLNLRMDQLRVIDKLSARQKDDERSGRHIRLSASFKVLNVTPQQLKSLDIHTFERIARLCDMDDNKYDAPMWKLNNRYSWENLLKLIQNLPTIAQKLSFMEKYIMNDKERKDGGDNCTYFNDYLRMRDQLKQILTDGASRNIKEDIEELARFDKDWPIFPEGGTIFHRYVPGGRLEVNRWGGEEIAYGEYSFKDFFRRRYSQDILTWIYDDDKALMGVTLKLSTIDRVVNLHDEISLWLSTKNDRQSAALFKEAYEKAKKMEYISEKYGLRIIAPSVPQDLKREGHVLSHCVGSYVDAVCKGYEKILFIRRIDMPSDPYFTLDIDAGGTLRQVHCYGNGNPTPEGIKDAYTRSGLKVYDQQKDILGFLLEWAKKTPGVKESSVQKHYACLCALGH